MSQRPWQTQGSQGSAAGGRNPPQPPVLGSPLVGTHEPWQLHGSVSPASGSRHPSRSSNSGSPPSVGNPPRGAPAAQPASRPSPLRNMRTVVPAGPPPSNYPVNVSELGLGRLPPRDPTIRPSVQQNRPGSSGGAVILPPLRGPNFQGQNPPGRQPLPPNFQGQNLSDQHPLLPPILGLPPMGQLIRMDAHEALNIFITARRTVFPHASLPEHKADFRLRYDQEVHRERAANAAANEFTQRFLAGTVPNLPPINQLSSMNIKEARRLFIDARAIAVPTATLLDHQGAFRVQLEDRIRRNNEAAAAVVRRNNEAAAALRARARDFAKRVLAGTVSNLPPMSNLIHTQYEDAIHIFVRARSFALPDASQQDH
ncbi:MAG: hypothetical protein LQ341_005900, partial [Variospora aurantia]